MAQIETWYNQDLKEPVKVHYLHGNVFSQDNQGNILGVNVFDDGSPASLSGSVSATIIRSDGGTVAASGTLSGNRVSVAIPQAGYAVPGIVSVIVKLTSGSVVITLLAVVATVYASSTNITIDPGTIIPDISELIAEIEAAIASIPADYSDLWESLAPTFNPDKTGGYKAGEYCTYNGGLYRFKTVHSGSWSASDVVAVNLGGEIQFNKRIVDGIDSDLNLYTKKEIFARPSSWVMKNVSKSFVAPSTGTYKSIVEKRTDFVAGKPYILTFESVEGAVDNEVLSVEPYNSSDTRLGQFIATKTNKSVNFVVPSDTSYVNIVYRLSFASSINVGTIVSYSGISIYSEPVVLNPDIMCEKNAHDYFAEAVFKEGTINSSTGAYDSSYSSRRAITEFVQFPIGFVVIVPSDLRVAVMQYSSASENDYVGYSSLEKDTVYIPGGYYYRFSIATAGGTAVTNSDLERIHLYYRKPLEDYTKELIDAKSSFWMNYVEHSEIKRGTIVSSTGVFDPSYSSRASLIDYTQFPNGFRIELPSNLQLTVAKYTTDAQSSYTGYDAVRKKAEYEASETYYRFTIINISGASVTDADIADVKILSPITTDEIVTMIEESSEDDMIPSYFVTEGDQVANSTLAKTNAPCLTFAMITDTHQDYTQKTVENLKYVDQKVGFEFLLHLGDVMSASQSKSAFLSDCYSEVEAYRSSVKSDKILLSVGNHDGYYVNGVPDISYNDELYQTMFRKTDGIANTVRDGDKPYYYVDFERLKVRMIVLSSKSYTVTNDTYTYIYGFLDEQVEWLLDVLQHTEDGWTLVVCSHIPPIDEVLNTPTFDVGITENNGQNIVDILAAWKARSTVTFKGTTYDFSGLTENVFAVWLCGHLHGDMVKVYDTLTFVVTTAVACFIPSSWVMPEGGSFVSDRTVETLTWDSWNSCVLRPYEKKLYLFRFGAGSDTVVDYSDE